MSKKIMFFLFLLSFANIFAQNFEFGEVSKAELSETTYKEFPEANAAVLYKNHDTYFNYSSNGVEVITVIHERVKIYNKDGFDYATHEVDLFKSRNSGERINKIKGFTYNLENGEIITTKLEKDQIFENEYSYNYDKVKFTMPNVKVGSIIEYTYKTTSPYYYYIDEVILQYDIPIKKVIASVRTPKVLKFTNTQKGYLTFSSTQSTKMDHRLGLSVEIDVYELQNVPPIVIEKYAGNINNYTAGVMLEFVAENFPAQHNYQRATSWKEVASTIGASADYKKELDKSNSYDDAIDALVSSLGTDSEKMNAIFNYVKKEIKWNGNDGKYFQKGIKEALKTHTGNAGDINLALVSMLRYAGLKANPVAISTKENGIPFFPTLDRLNYVVAHVDIEEKSYYLDATEEFSDINLMPIKNYNWRGVMVDNKNKKWGLLSIRDINPSNGQHQLKAKVSSDGSIQGTLNSRFSNHYAMNIKNDYKNSKEDEYIANREEKYRNIEISDYKIENVDTPEGMVSESFKYSQEDGAELIAGEIYLDPFAFFKYDENPFKLEERLYPIDFEFPQKDQYIISYEIPEGYAIKTLTKSIKAITPDKEAEFILSASSRGNIIQISIIVNLKKAIISSESYMYVKEFFNQLISKNKERIVLAKA